MQLADYRLGFSTLEREVEQQKLLIRGKIPAWLDGMLLRTGPAKFEVGEEKYRHWLDGLAMLHKFSFDEGQVFYSNKFLESQAYLAAKEKGKISRSEFGTLCDRSFFRRLLDLFASKQLTDNANVNITKLGDRLVSVTETPFPVVFEPKTLDTVETYQFEAKIKGQVTTAHPHFDFRRHKIYNYQVHFARRSSYNIYFLKMGENRQHLLSSVSVKEPAYIHSFGMSENYIILVEFPLVANPLSLLTRNIRGKPFIENYSWKPERGTRFFIIDKRDGSLVNTCFSEAFFAFHHVNAFEQDNQIILDITAYPDASIIDTFYLNNLRRGKTNFPACNLRRYCLPLHDSTTKFEILSDKTVEFPRINYKSCNGQNYRFVYGGDNARPNNFIDRLVKVDVQKGTESVWQEESCYPGEPVFVAAPAASAEDEGTVLSVVLDVSQKKSFLLILDASSFGELARAEIPHHIPFGFHGQYLGEGDESANYAYIHR